MSSIKEATDLVIAAIESLNRELNSSSDPTLSSVPRVQKKAIKLGLEKILNYLNSGVLPEKGERNLGLSHAIADNWPFGSKLSEEISKAERAFIEVRQSSEKAP